MTELMSTYLMIRGDERGNSTAELQMTIFSMVQSTEDPHDQTGDQPSRGGSRFCEVQLPLWCVADSSSSVFTATCRVCVCVCVCTLPPTAAAAAAAINTDHKSARYITTIAMVVATRSPAHHHHSTPLHCPLRLRPYVGRGGV